MSVGQTALDLFGDAPSESDPQIYVASPLTHLAEDSDAKRLVESEVHQICRAIHDVTNNADPPWRARVYAPMQWTAPWNQADTDNPEDLFNKNRRLVIGDTDGLIVHGFRGGSMGVGQEFVWAQEVGVPILYVHRTNEPVSRQVRGTPALISVESFSEPAQLDDKVARFLRIHRHVIEDGPRRRRNRVIRFEIIQTQLMSAWSQVGEQEQARISATMSQHPAYLESVVSDPLETSIAPIAVLTTLLAHLRVDFSILHGESELPDFEVGQLRALMTAADEHDWDDETVELLMNTARVELARTTVRRFRLDAPDDWLRLFRAL